MLSGIVVDAFGEGLDNFGYGASLRDIWTDVPGVRRNLRAIDQASAFVLISGINSSRRPGVRSLESFSPRTRFPGSRITAAA